MGRTINGRTTTLALIGDPVGHSTSPEMHNYASELLGLNYAYVAFTVKEDQVPAAFDAMRTLGIRGYNVTLPVVFDWEIVNSENARTRGLSTAQLMACTKAFCRRVQRAGYAPMVYFNADWGYLNFDLSQITQYDFWLAQYKEQPDFYYNFKYWQYTSKGSVNGISGNVDLDVILLPR